jgi:hypothetical protein
MAQMAFSPLKQKLNAEWHDTGLKVFMAIVLAHWAEHLVQAFQIFALGWPRGESFGVLGQFYPWMFKSELLHYAYAVVMLAGLWIFLPGYKGRGLFWWKMAFWIQFWHHIEHALLQGQAIAGQNLFGAPVPMSILQLWIPRVELHLFYNAVVFVPMVIAMYYHLFPSKEEHAAHACSCAWHSPKAA